MSECRYCGNGIGWRKEGGRNLPFNVDGTAHNCKTSKEDSVTKAEMEARIHSNPTPPSSMEMNILMGQAFNLGMEKTVADRELYSKIIGNTPYDFWSNYAKNVEDCFKAMLMIKPSLQKHGG